MAWLGVEANCMHRNDCFGSLKDEGWGKKGRGFQHQGCSSFMFRGTEAWVFAPARLFVPSLSCAAVVKLGAIAPELSSACEQQGDLVTIHAGHHLHAHLSQRPPFHCSSLLLLIHQNSRVKYTATSKVTKS